MVRFCSGYSGVRSDDDQVMFWSVGKRVQLRAGARGDACAAHEKEWNISTQKPGIYHLKQTSLRLCALARNFCFTAGHSGFPQCIQRRQRNRRVRRRAPKTTLCGNSLLHSHFSTCTRKVVLQSPGSPDDEVCVIRWYLGVVARHPEQAFFTLDVERHLITE